MKFRVNLLKILRHSFVLLFFVFVFNDRLKAQHWTTCDAQGSDYKIHLTFDKLYNKPCQCRNDYIGVFAAKNSFSSTDSWFIHIISSDSTAGRYDHIVGPGYSTDYYITYFYGGRECPHPTTICNTCQVFGTERNCSVKYQVASNIGATTSSIKKPKNVYATKDTSDTYIDIKWQKGTNIPDTATVSGTHGVFLDLVYYKIYRNDTLIATLNGDKYFYRDAGLAPGRTCKYSVTTFTNKFGTGDHESDKNGTGAYATGSTFSLNLTASDNEFTNKTVLKWRDISKQADEIEVSRFENGKWEQIAVVSKFSKTYNDMDGIPGVEYNYSIQPVKVGATFFPAYDLGSRANNGIISGKVLSPYNAGVSDVVVFAKAVINGDTLSYSDTTDNSGYYEIKGVYYHKSAEFKIYPSKAKHFFKPDLLIRTLDLESPKISSVDFTDTSVFTINGNVRYPVSGASSYDTCGIADVKILLNGKEICRTDASGFYAFAVQEEKTYEIAPKYLHHKFDTSKVSIPINGNYFGLNFYDVEKDTIFVKVQGGCSKIIATSVDVRIRSTLSPLCYDTTIVTNASGIARIILAAREYQVEVVKIEPVNSNIMFQIGHKPIRLNLVKRDSIKNTDPIYTYDTIPDRRDTLPNDSIFIVKGHINKTTSYDSTKRSKPFLAEFIYMAPLTVKVDFDEIAEKMVCLPGPNGVGKVTVPMMEKGTRYPLTIEVTEGSSGCHVEYGKIRVYDYVGDKEKTATELAIKNGFAYYQIDAGDPMIANGGEHTNQKLFFMLVEVGFLDPKPIEQWVFVSGAKARDKTFATRSAGIPFIVLHDPPGDQSYAFIEKGTTISNTLNIDNTQGSSGGLQEDLTIGVAVKVIFGIFDTKAGVAVNSTITSGKDESNRTTRVVNYTFNERFSTTNAEWLTGYPGDVFVGSAFNMIYSLADAVYYDDGKCDIKRDTIVAIDPVGFATTFIYTEGFITENLIPRLEEIKKLAPADSAKHLQIDIDNWNEIIKKNSWNRDSLAVKLPGEKGNISISNGASYESYFESDSSSTSSYELKTFLNSEMFIGGRLEVEGMGAWVEAKIGAVANTNYSFTKTKETGKEEKTTIGFHIEDNDDGDYHSIDILNDTKNGVPAFRLVSGATSCPNEPKTQRRDLADLNLIPAIITNVPPADPAVFTLEVVNNSQSDEARQYIIQVVPESNPDGAIIKIAGQNINFSPATFYLWPRQKAAVKLTVERGPLASQYKDIKIYIIAECEKELFSVTTSADTIHLSVDFKSECSTVEIYQPVDNWIYNSSQGDKFNVALTGYNANDPNLESVIVQYRREGRGWEDGVEIPKDSLIDKFYDAKLNAKYLLDGNYQLRAVANCRSKLSTINYSEVVNGKIDRKKLELFGSPYPKNGILRYSDEIKIICSEDIDPSVKYYPGKISLQQKDNKKFYPVTYQIKGSELIINPSPISILDNLEGKTLIATVNSIEDLSGNVTTAPIQWEFMVSRSPVYWEPNYINYTMERGKPGNFTATLKNGGPTAGNFTITKYPIWLSPDILSGSVGSLGGTQNITMTVASGINPGIYSDTVIALSGSYKISLFVRLEVLTPEPRWVKQAIEASKFEHSMNIIAQFSVNATDIPLSMDIRDEIGVFINDSLRGKGKIKYDPQLRKYFAYITIYSNSENNDSMSFRMWDAYPGVQYRAVETRVFRKDALLGQFSSPFILHPKGIYQTISMKKGWNWFSLFVKNQNQTPAGIFGKAAKDSMTIVKTRDNYSQYGNNKWYGNLDTVRAGIGYMVNVPKADTVEIYGTSYTNVVTPIEGNMNWSWIGNADLFGSVIKSKLRNLKSETNDVIKSQNEFAVYDKSVSNWLGSLGYLEPGAAYKMSIKTPGEIVPGETKKLYKTLPTWNFDFNGMEYNMNVTAELWKGTHRVFDSHYLIGAFINGKCQGIAQPVYSDELKRYVVFLTLFGNDAQIGQKVTLKLYDTDLGVEIPQASGNITFSPDAVNGSVPDPFDMVINTTGIGSITKSQTSMVCYPNPFGTQIHIDLNLAAKYKVEIYITDALGRRIETLHNGVLAGGNQTWLWDGNKVPQGIYFCVARFDDGEVIHTTLMKK